MDIMEINEVIKFENGELSLDVRVSPSEDTVWLSLDQIAKLFDRNKSTISRHIKKLFDVVSEDIKKAMLARDKDRLEALRSVNQTS